MRQKMSYSTPEIKEYKNKYRLAAEQIYANLGDKNWDNVYNCITRFRANITDKSLVNVEQLKKIQVVKQVLFSGNELQIVIGGEVTKVTDEFNKYIKELATPKAITEKTTNKVKVSFGTKILGAVVGIMSPAVPIMLAAATIAALRTLLAQFGVIADVNGVMDISNHDLLSGGMYVLSLFVFSVLGVFFIFNTTKYLKGDLLFAIIIGLTLICRGFFPLTAGTPYGDAHFGDWVGGNDDTLGKSGWLLFKLGDYPMVIGGYEGSVIPFIAAGFISVYLNKWVKTWMPTTIDTIFRPAIVYFGSMLLLWFGIGPIVGLIEYGLTLAVTHAGTLPYGIGVMIFAPAWQIMVFFGISNVVGTIINLPVIAGGTSALIPAMTQALLGQLGAVLAVCLVTKNKNLRAIGLGTVAGAIFGITEPMMYGVTIPKFKAFICGLIGGAVAGLVTGLLGVHANILAGWGVFEILGYTEGAKQILFVILGWIIALGVSFGLTLLFYTERKNELSYFKKGVNKFIKIAHLGKENQEFETFETEIKSMKPEYKKVSKYYAEISKYEQQLVSLENKESKHREKLYKELIKLKTKLSKNANQEMINKFNKLNEEYSKYNLDKEKEIAQNKLNNVLRTNKLVVDKFNQQKEEIYQQASTKIILPNETDKLVIQNIFWNALNSVEIGFGIEDAKPTKFKKGEK